MFSPTSRHAARLFALSSAVLIFTSSVLAQSTGGRIIGRVSDSSGAVVSGVTVTLVNSATGVSRDA